MFFGGEVNHLPNYMQFPNKPEKRNTKKYKPGIEASYLLKFQKYILACHINSLFQTAREDVDGGGRGLTGRSRKMDEKKKERLVMMMIIFMKIFSLFSCGNSAQIRCKEQPQGLECPPDLIVTSLIRLR